MVLEKIDDGAQRLLLVLCLPLIDGVFATLLVTGAVSTFSDIITVGLTVFTGAGALAVLYSESENSSEAFSLVNQVAPVLLAGALIVALIAPVFDQIFNISRLKYAAGLALLTIPAKLVDIELAEKFSVPAIVVTGMFLSLRSGATLSLSLEYVLPALLTSTAAIGGLYLASYLSRDNISLRYIRGGGAVVLTVISASLFGYDVPSNLGLALFMVSLALSYNRG
ncbi:hypothetical protein AQV86_00935 [Nanohaloarchaea archaeon SG9]|nr:hypothetical protein AQV86_00935 [Nanohaloarchaea archaeon SG9]